jgi:hypothetical protein
MEEPITLILKSKNNVSKKHPLVDSGRLSDLDNEGVLQNVNQQLMKYIALYPRRQLFNVRTQVQMPPQETLPFLTPLHLLKTNQLSQTYLTINNPKCSHQDKNCYWLC